MKFDTDNTDTDPPPVLAAGDLDGDGRTDLVLRMRYGIDIFLQRDGTFADRKFIELPVASRVDVADLDGDGTAELIMTGHSGIVVHRSLGGTALSPAVRISDEYASKLAVGDVTGDGRPDLVATGGELRVYRQLADGTFAGAVRYPVEGRYSSAVAIGDLSGDGRADVVVANGWGNSLDTSEINILTQTPSGTLGAPTSYVNPKPETLRVADVDGDRRNDIVVSHDGSVGLMLHLADGRFTPEQSFPLRYSASHLDTALVVADVTGDGQPDVAVADHNNGLALLRNTAPWTPAQKATRHVARMARDLLGRPPTAPESAAWTPIAGTPTGRVNLAVALVRGTEYRTRFINEHARSRWATTSIRPRPRPCSTSWPGGRSSTSCPPSCWDRTSTSSGWDRTPSSSSPTSSPPCSASPSTPPTGPPWPPSCGAGTAASPWPCTSSSTPRPGPTWSTSPTSATWATGRPRRCGRGGWTPSAAAWAPNTWWPTWCRARNT